MLRRRVLTAIAGLALVPLLAACGTNTYELTQHQLPSGNGAFATSGAIKAQNVLLVADMGNTGRYSLIGSFVNLSGTDDNLAAVLASNGAPNRASGLPATLMANGTTQLTGVVLSYASTSAAPVLPGRYVTLKLIFARNGVVDIHVMVVAPVGQYAGLGPN